ncbi:MAG TPA: PilZ domain-containing protein [Sphingomicrobium sp.]|nr:PilZ domain-containing protein [Sphingomicrobium sp.]
MPMLAQFEEVSPRTDRRRSARRELKLGVSASEQNVTVHDLSLTGALLETSVPMLVGQVFQVELPDAGKVSATIVWNSGEYYGCQFDYPIAPSTLSAALLRSAPARPGTEPDPVSELRALSNEVEHLSLMMERALKRLSRD